MPAFRALGVAKALFPFLNSMTGSSHKSSKTRSRRVSGLDSVTLQVKCSFCGNTFYARATDAVCPKCERPANCDLPALWRGISLLLPPLGFGYALWIRAHSPWAAWQGLKWSLCGTALISGVLLLMRGF